MDTLPDDVLWIILKDVIVSWYIEYDDQDLDEGYYLYGGHGLVGYFGPMRHISDVNIQFERVIFNYGTINGQKWTRPFKRRYSFVGSWTRPFKRRYYFTGSWEENEIRKACKHMKRGMYEEAKDIFMFLLDEGIYEAVDYLYELKLEGVII